MTDGDDKKPREWWITRHGGQHEVLGPDTPHTGGNKVHVIEYSAFAALEKDRAVATDAYDALMKISVAEVAELKRQLDEQLLVNGKGQQRELKLMTERDELKRQQLAESEETEYWKRTRSIDLDAANRLIAKLEAELKAAREEIEVYRADQLQYIKRDTEMYPASLYENLRAQIREARAEIERLKEKP